MNTQALVNQVKYNCNISDARAWGYYSICGLLMRLRGLYRQERSLEPWEPIPESEIMPWIAEREREWERLQDAELEEIEIEGRRFGPFDSPTINAILNGHGYVYGGGYGLFRKPTFFLAELMSRKEIEGCLFLYAGRELCRDISASSAMFQDGTVFVRLEPLRGLLWEKFQELKGRKFGGLIQEAFSSAGIEKEAVPAEAYEKIAEVSGRVADILALHELGEAVENDGEEEWLRILGGNSDRFIELYLRGIKDVVADTSEKGPLKMIVENRDRVLLNFYMVLLDGIRKELFPEILGAYQEVAEGGDWARIERARNAGYLRTGELRGKVICIWREKNSLEEIKTFLAGYVKNGASAL